MNISVTKTVTRVVKASIAARTVVVNTPVTKVIITKAGTQGPEGIQGPPGAVGSGVAGVALSGHRLVEVGAGGTLVYATGYRAVGITQGATVMGDVTTFQQSGTLAEPSWSWSPQMPIYQGALGALTQAIPTTGFIRQVGIALTATSMVIELQSPIILE